jgi:hypothetical protein
MKEQDLLEDLGVNGRTIGHVFKEIHENWNRFILLRISGSVKHSNETCGSIKEQT